MSNHLRSMLLVILTIFLSWFSLQAQTVYQVAAGDSTLRDAIVSAADGDILELTSDGGVYVNPSITLGKSITIRAQEGLFAKPILKNPVGGQFFKLDTTASLTLKGLDLDGDARDLGASSILKYSIIVKTGDTSLAAITINIDDCDIHESSDKLIKLYRYSVIDSVNIHNSTFYNCAKEAVCLYEGSSSAPMARLGYAEVINSTFYGIGREAIKLQSNPNTKLLVDHVTCYDVGNGGTKAVVYVRNASDVTVKNSIFENNNETTGFISLANQSNVLNNCVFWDVVDKDIDNSDTVTDTLYADPLFVDPMNADFTLGSSSPALAFADDGKAAGDTKWDPSYVPGQTIRYVAAGDSTLRDAIVAASDGDILELTSNGGVYVNPNITLHKSLTIRAAEGLIAKPVLKNPTAGTSNYIFKIDTSVSVTLHGLDLDGDATAMGADAIAKYIIRIETAGILPDPITLKISDCNLHDASDKLLKPYKNSVIDTLQVMNTTFYNSAKEGVVLYSGSSSDPQVNLDYAEFTNCTFYGMVREGIKGDTNPNTVVRINHCTFYDCGASKKGMIFFDDMTDVEVKNSIFDTNGYSSYFSRFKSSVSTFHNNVVFNVTSYKVSSATALDTLRADPQFADAANADFTLALTSPALGFADDARAAGDLRWEAVAGKYKLTLTATGSGNILADPAGPYYDPNTVVTLTAVPATDWKFVSWVGALVFPPNNPVVKVTMDGNKSVTANFEIAKARFSINMTTMGVGHVEFSPAPLDSTTWSYYDGTDVTMTAVSDSASMSFTEWTGGLTGSVNPAVVGVTSDLDITAVFSPNVTQYVLNVDTVGLGTVSFNPLPYADYGSYDMGSVVNLVAHSLPGFEFSGWSGDLSSPNDSLQVTMDSNVAVTATFMEINVASGYLEVADSMNLADAVAFARNNSQVNTLVLTTSGGLYTAHKYIAVDFPLTVMAKAGLAAKPRIEGNPDLTYSDGVFQVREGGTSFTLKGVEVYSSKYQIRTDDVPLHTVIRIEDCYIHDAGEVWVKVYKNSHVDSLLIINSVFREVVKEGIYLKEPASWDYAMLENSTFIRSGREALRARDNVDATLMINHCNFDSISWNSSYRTLYPEGVKNATVTNCIISNQVSGNADFIRAYGTSVVSNILTWNASNNVNTEDAVVVDTTKIWTFDPLFKDIANRDYTLTDASHAYGLATDGKAVGDLRWATGTPTHKALNVTVEGNGKVMLSPEPVGLTYDPGTVVTVTAVPDSAWQFAYWSGELTGTVGSQVVTMDADVSVTATFTIVVGLEDGQGLPSEYALHQNYPNPFNPQTTIRFDLKKAGLTTVKVYNVLGQEIAVLMNKKLQVGRYNLTFQAPSFASGIYFYRIQSGDFSAIKKMMLVK